jgi:hypothetical protein
MAEKEVHTMTTNEGQTFEEYCAGRTGRDPVPALDPVILKNEARNVLGHYGMPGGYLPGSFTAALIRCFELADNSNRAKLDNLWPELAHAIYLLRTGQDAGLLAVAEGRVP